MINFVKRLQSKNFRAASSKDHICYNVKVMKKVIIVAILTIYSSFNASSQRLITQMLNAYLLAIPIEQDAFVNYKMCLQEDGNNCFSSWNTMRKKFYTKFYKEYFTNAVYHNVLTWEMNGYYFDGEYYEGRSPRGFGKLMRHKYDT